MTIKKNQWYAGVVQMWVVLLISSLLSACSSGGSNSSDALALDSCGSTHPNVGKSVQFEGFEHDVSGKLTVLNDCTLEISEFNYDGEGPAVYFYAGQARQYATGSEFLIGDLLTGTVYENATLSLTVPDGKTLDDFDSLSVWCVDFAINFGDAYFGSDL